MKNISYATSHLTVLPKHKLVLKALLLLSIIVSPSLYASDSSWKSLFNGKDLSGWETFISMQPPSNTYGIKLDSTRGLNNDPLKVFSVVNGLLRVSGEEWGGLTTIEKFENFELSFDVKWGEKKWPPREQALRDSGVLYYAVGRHGAQSGHWMRSHEFQVQEGDCGDYHSLDGVLVDAKVTDANEGDWKFYRYDPKAPVRENIHTRILKLKNYEKPGNEWNTMTVIANGKTLVHKVNGHEVLRVSNSRQTINEKIVPLTRGKIQIQSEGAEVFYRNIKIKALDKSAKL